MTATALPAAIPAELTALLARQPLAKLVYLANEIGGCDQSPVGRAIEGALHYAIDTLSETGVSETEVYDLLAEIRSTF